MNGYELREYFKKQLKENPTITETVLNEINNDRYYSGKKINPGEVVLFALIEEEGGVITTEESSFNLVNISERDLNLYDLNKKIKQIPFNDIPIIKIR